MVSTRHHPRAYPPPELATPDAKSGTSVSSSAVAASTAASSTSGKSASKARSVRSKSRPRVGTTSPRAESPTSPTSASSGALARTRSRRSTAGSWAHTPSNLTLVWLAISLPLVVWDTGYVLLRPWTMPGGWLHAPFWTPYALYGQVDHIYGFKAIEKKNGFTSAQGALNAIETAMYFGYLLLVYRFGEQDSKKTTKSRSRKSVDGRGAPGKKVAGWLGEARVLGGGVASSAVLLAFAASLMTLSKTVLYFEKGLCEYYSGFDNIGHNSLKDLIFLWIIPNGAWIVVPTYMTYTFGAEILEGLTVASGTPVPKALATKEE